MHKFVLRTISTALLMTTPSWSYQLISPLLDHLNCVSEKTHEYKVSILNNEEEDIEAEIQFSGLIQKKDGLAALADSLPAGVKIEDLNKNFFVPKGERKDFVYRIETQGVDKSIPFLGLGILVAKKNSLDKKDSTESTNKFKAGLVIRQKFLVQLMMKLSKTGLGTASIKEITFDDGKLKFTIQNNANHLLEGDIVFFLKNQDLKTNDPLSQYVRVLPNQEREYKIDFQSTAIHSISLFFDNPHFELLEMEYLLK